MNKLRFAFMWAASYGGCEVAVLDINEKILDVAAIAEIAIWPVALDFKYKDIEALSDQSLDVVFFNGAVRNSEQEHLAKLLRVKAKAMVAFGSCASLGGIPGLANRTSRERILKKVYGEPRRSAGQFLSVRASGLDSWEGKSGMKTITIDPITRLEGHGKIEIFLNDAGEVENAYLQIPELRGFEKFCEGRPVEELPRITPKICGVCPGAHHMASTKAVDAVFPVEPTPAAKKLRELFYMAHFIHSHIAHFYALAAPDFVMGPKAAPADRNILGVVGKVGLEIGGEVIRHRAYAHQIQALIEGHATHPVCGLPGGMSRAITEEERAEVEQKAKSCVEFAKVSIGIFSDVVPGNKACVDLILGSTYTMQSYCMGLVDERNRVSFYDGDLRVVDPDGKEFLKFKPADYAKHIGEHVESWTYLKFPFLRKVGWKRLVEGRDNGIYRVAPLGRLNAADGMATPQAQEEYQRMYTTLGGKPIHATLATHWARLIELVYSAERLLELAQDPEVTSGALRNLPTEIPDEGVGVVEAPRGTLFHHYKTDEKGIVTAANLIVATSNNYPTICLSAKKPPRG